MLRNLIHRVIDGIVRLAGKKVARWKGKRITQSDVNVFIALLESMPFHDFGVHDRAVDELIARGLQDWLDIAHNGSDEEVDALLDWMVEQGFNIA